MNYSYTQISQYITCPRRYRHRYLDGWKEKDTGSRKRLWLPLMFWAASRSPHKVRPNAASINWSSAP